MLAYVCESPYVFGQLYMHTKQGRLQLEFNQDPKNYFVERQNHHSLAEMTKGQEISG